MKNLVKLIDAEILMDKAYTVSVKIDYTKSVWEMIAATQFDRVDKYEVEEAKYCLNGSGIVEMDLMVVGLKEPALAVQINEACDILGFSPANIEHLLAYAAKHKPRGEFNNTIHALGTTYRHSSGRYLTASIIDSNSYPVERWLYMSSDGSVEKNGERLWDPRYTFGNSVRLLVYKKK